MDFRRIAKACRALIERQEAGLDDAKAHDALLKAMGNYSYPQVMVEMAAEIQKLHTYATNLEARNQKLEKIRVVKRYLELEAQVGQLEWQLLNLRQENVRLSERNKHLEPSFTDPWKDLVINWIRVNEIERFATRECLIEAIGIPPKKLDGKAEIEFGRRLGQIMRQLGPGDWVESTYERMEEDGPKMRGWKNRPFFVIDAKGNEHVDPHRVLAPGGRRRLNKPRGA